MTDYKPPPPPPGLDVAGKAAWAKLTQAYEFSAGELQLVEQFCATKDRIALLEEALAETGVFILGSRGQRTLNPVINQIAVQTTLLDRLMLSLALPAEYETDGVRRSPQARQAANARWGKVRKGRLPSIGEGGSRGA
jgi:hypothetical protein